MLRFTPLYLKWHYGRALADFRGVWVDLLWFVGHVFSVPMMLRTLFSPWRRMNEALPRSFMDLEAIGEALIVNVLMRIVGFVARIVIIGIALLSYAFLSVAGVLALAVWLSLPLLVPVFIVGSFNFLA